MQDVVLTGASRGIGRAFALALASPARRLLLLARDAGALDEVAGEVRRRGGDALVLAGDLGSVRTAAELGDRLLEVARPGLALVHNAGLWPSRRTLNAEGLEEAFVVNHLAPLALQRPLVEEGRVRRLFVISAGLLVKGRFDPARSPTGEDFSGVGTYCRTKLCLALASRDVAEAHPELDVAVLHPGVVRTDLGARPGLLGAALRLVKRRWEAPEVCAGRLVQVFERERWSSPGRAAWIVEDEEQPWPPNTEDPDQRRAVRETTAQLLARYLDGEERDRA